MLMSGMFRKTKGNRLVAAPGARVLVFCMINTKWNFNSENMSRHPGYCMVAPPEAPLVFSLMVFQTLPQESPVSQLFPGFTGISAGRQEQ